MLMMFASKKSDSRSANWAAVRDAVLGLLLLVAIKLAAIPLDYGCTQYKALIEFMVDSMDRPGITPEPEAAKTWRPYDEMAVQPNIPQERLDVERCVYLHNLILELGWAGLHRDAEQEVEARPTITWWEHWQRVEEQAGHLHYLQDVLTPDLVEFLKRAQMPAEGLAFSYFYEGLTAPSEMVEQMEHFDMLADEQAVLLYPRTWTEDRYGLIFDMRNNIACYASLMWSEPFGDFQQYFPLEFILAAYIGLVQDGKVVALPQRAMEAVLDTYDRDGFRFPQYENVKPWVLKPYGERQLERTLELFKRLQKAIWERMPAEAKTAQGEQRMHERLICPEALADKPDVPTGSFLYNFLTRAAGCPFRYIAPGLECPTPQNIASFLREPPRPPPPDPAKYSLGEPAHPIMLFGSDEVIEDDVDGSFFYGVADASLTGMCGGLYLNSQTQTNDGYQDGMRLVTPFPVGTNGFARLGNDIPIEDQPSRWHRYQEGTQGNLTRDSEAYTSLFQGGGNSFHESHYTQLVVVLLHWLELVETGLWTVGPAGVEGGMDVFRMADSEAHWWRYAITPSTP